MLHNAVDKAFWSYAGIVQHNTTSKEQCHVSATHQQHARRLVHEWNISSRKRAAWLSVECAVCLWYVWVSRIYLSINTDAYDCVCGMARGKCAKMNACAQLHDSPYNNCVDIAEIFRSGPKWLTNHQTKRRRIKREIKCYGVVLLYNQCRFKHSSWTTMLCLVWKLYYKFCIIMCHDYISILTWHCFMLLTHLHSSVFTVLRRDPCFGSIFN